MEERRKEERKERGGRRISSVNCFHQELDHAGTLVDGAPTSRTKKSEIIGYAIQTPPSEVPFKFSTGCHGKARLMRERGQGAERLHHERLQCAKNLSCDFVSVTHFVSHQVSLYSKANGDITSRETGALSFPACAWHLKQLLCT